MLSFERPHVEVEGMVLFPDHEDAGLWYYTAAPPRVAIGPQQRPMFDLWVYTEDLVHDMFAGTRLPDQMGGGFLTLGVNCRRDAAQLGKARKALARALDVDDDALRLAPIPYTGGKVTLIALDALQFPPGTPDPAAADPNAGRPRFVTAVTGSAMPALMGDLQAIFSLSLSERGAAFMAGLFKGGGTPVGVVYELGYEGLCPAVHVRITADMTKLRRHFGGGIEGQVQWFKADVSAALDHLETTQAVRIDVTQQDGSDAANAAREQAISLFKEDLIQQLFRPTAPVAPQPAPGADAVAAIAGLANSAGGAATAAATGGVSGSLGLTLRAEQETAHLSGIYDYSARMPRPRTDAPQAFLQTLIRPEDAARHTTVVDLGTASSFFDRVEAIVSLPEDAVFAALDLRQAVVSLAYGEDDPARPPAVKPPLVCAPGGDRHRRLAFLRDGRDSMALSYDITYEFDDDPVRATVDKSRYQTPRRTSTSRAIMVDPTGDFGYRRLVLRPGRIPAGVREVDVAARFQSGHGFQATRRFRLFAPFDRTLAAVAPEGADWPIRTETRDPGQVDLALTWVMSDGSRLAMPEARADGFFVTLDAPFAGQRDLLIQPNVVSPSVEAMDVEVEYDDPASGYHRRFVLTLAPPFAAQRIEFPIVNPALRRVRVRTTVREGGITSQTPWEATDEPTKVVGADAARGGVVTVRLIGGALEAFGLDAVIVELRSTDHTGALRQDELFFAPGDPVTAPLPLVLRPGVPVAFEFRTRAFRNTGAETVSDWASRTGTTNLVIPLVTL